MARAVAPLNFNVFLEKAKLKDDGSNFVDWARNLRIILTAAQKSYVLDALMRLEVCRYFPKEEGMMQHSYGRYFPQ